MTTALVMVSAGWCLTAAYVGHRVCEVAELAINRAKPCDLAAVLRASATLAEKVLNQRKRTGR